MKPAIIKYLIVPCVALLCSINASAQMNKLFYGESWSNVHAVKDSISSVVNYKVTFDTTTEKNYHVNFQDKVEVNILKQGDKISRVIIAGNYEDLIIIYQSFIEKSADKDLIKADGHAKVKVVDIDGKKLPIAFFKDSHGWLLLTRYAD